MNQWTVVQILLDVPYRRPFQEYTGGGIVPQSHPFEEESDMSLVARNHRILETESVAFFSESQERHLGLDEEPSQRHDILSVLRKETLVGDFPQVALEVLQTCDLVEWGVPVCARNHPSNLPDQGKNGMGSQHRSFQRSVGTALLENSSYTCRM
jgi:hypothetical protein